MNSKSNKGDATLDVLLFAGIVLFIILPVFSFSINKYIYYNNAQLIKDTMDLTAIAAYESMNKNSYSKDNVNIDESVLQGIYEKYLADNLKLNSDLSPKSNSIAKGLVVIEELTVYTSDLPKQCSLNVTINKASIHAIIDIPMKPDIFRKMILDISGKDTFILRVHQDTEIPVNN